MFTYLRMHAYVIHVITKLHDRIYVILIGLIRSFRCLFLLPSQSP